MSQAKNTYHVVGSLEIMSHQDLHNSRISRLGSPILSNDAATKGYVDNSITGSNLTGGIGITINTTTNSININSAQTSITTLGTIQNGTWNANTLQIAYGGTGVTNFSSSKLIYYNGSNQLVSSQDLTISSTNFNCNLPVSITNTVDTVSSLSTTGSLVVSGGVNIAKQLYIGGNARFAGNVTVGNMTINGNLSLATVNASNAVFTSVSTSSLNSSTINLVSYIVTPLTSTSNLLAFNATITSLQTVNNTMTNLVNNTLTTGTLYVTGISQLSTTNATSISTGLISVTTGISSNFVSTNLSSGSLRVSSTGTLLNCIISSGTISNLTVPVALTTPNLNSISLVSTSANISTITNTNFINTNATITNILLTNTTTANLTVVNTVNSNVISTGNVYISNTIFAPNVSTTNITNVNQTLANTVITFASIASLRVSGNTQLANALLTNLTGSSLFVTNYLNSTYNIFVGVTSSNLNVTGVSVFSTTNSSSTSTGTLFSSVSSSTNSSIGTLNVSGNIYNSEGTIYISNATSTNLYASNLVNSLSIVTSGMTCSNINIGGTSTLSTVNSVNLSTGTLSVSGTTLTQNLGSTNQTTTNILNTNFSSSNIRVTTASMGNCSMTNSSVSNISLVNANATSITCNNLLVNTNANFNKNLSIVSAYQGGVVTSAGSFFNIFPCTYTNNVTVSGGSVNAWYANHIAPATLVASNSSVITNKATNLYIQSNVLLGANETISYNSGLLMGYVNNVTGGSLNTQISFERADGNAFAGIYTENVTNKLVIVNSSLSGGSGLGIYTIKDTPIVYSSIPSSSNITPTTYIQLLNTTSTFYSTTDSNSTSTGSLVLSGGLGVAKNITSTSASITSLVTSTISTGNVYVNGNLTVNNGYVTSTGYLIDTLTTNVYNTGTNDLVFNIIPTSYSRITVTNKSYNATLMNIITFQDPGFYQFNLKLHSLTTTTSATLLQTHLNLYTAGNWVVFQSASSNTVLDSFTDISSKFMLFIEAAQECKFTLNSASTVSFDNSLQWSRLMINRIG